MTNRNKILGGLAAGSALLAPVQLMAQHSPNAPFRVCRQAVLPVFRPGNGDRLVAGMRLPEGAAVVKAVATHKGKKTTIALYVDDVPAGSMELSSKVNIAPKSNAFQVGRSWGVPVNKDYSSPFLFNGKIFKAAIDVER